MDPSPAPVSPNRGFVTSTAAVSYCLATQFNCIGTEGKLAAEWASDYLIIDCKLVCCVPTIKNNSDGIPVPSFHVHRLDAILISCEIFFAHATLLLHVEASYVSEILAVCWIDEKEVKCTSCIDTHLYPHHLFQLKARAPIVCAR